MGHHALHTFSWRSSEKSCPKIIYLGMGILGRVLSNYCDSSTVSCS